MKEKQADRKIVLFTQRVEIVEAYQERRDCADQRIAEFILSAGFLPVPVPNSGEIAAAMTASLRPAGIVLTGGNSLVRYGGNAPERDETDRQLIGEAHHLQIPLYGFCRGMQSILDYFGETLTEVSGHVAVRHVIRGEEPETEVNSYHRQACTGLKGGELVAVMTAEDGVIEKVRHRSLPIVGTMWHPERENPFRETDRSFLMRLFQEQEAAGGKERKDS